MSDPDPPFDDPVILPLEDHLDLHPFQPREIADVVEEYLEQCRQAGFREVRLIHGKGKGVQRNIIRALLEKNPQVESFHDAPLEAGSWGATVVILKSSGRIR
jgi:DNA-nicking Smr family endonuclease